MDGLLLGILRSSYGEFRFGGHVLCITALFGIELSISTTLIIRCLSQDAGSHSP